MTSLHTSSKPEESNDGDARHCIGSDEFEPPVATEFSRGQPLAEPDPDHDLAIESPMPAIQTQQGRRTHVVILILLSALVVSCFIGIPLALFANGFTDEPLVAGATAGLALAAFFGWVVRGLRATTRKPPASTPLVVVTAAAAPAGTPMVAVTTAAAPASTPLVVVTAAAAASTPRAVAAAAAAPESTPQRVAAAAVAPASTPQAVVAAEAAPASTPQRVAAEAAPASTPQRVAADAVAPASTPQAVASAAAEGKVRIETRPTAPPTGIVGLLFSGPPAAVPRRTARMRRMTTGAGSIGDILDLRPEGEPDPENVRMLTG